MNIFNLLYLTDNALSVSSCHIFIRFFILSTKWKGYFKINNFINFLTMLIPSYTNEFFARHTLSRNTKYKVYNESLSLKRKKDKSTYINSFYSIHTTEAISISLSQIPENNQKQAPLISF